VSKVLICLRDIEVIMVDKLAILGIWEQETLFEGTWK